MFNVKSKIDLFEAQKNKEKKPMEDSVYFPVMIVKGQESYPALFTKHQIDVAIERADKNPEDAPYKENLIKGFFKKLFKR